MDQGILPGGCVVNSSSSFFDFITDSNLFLCVLAILAILSVFSTSEKKD